MWAAWKGKAGVVEWLVASSAKLDRQEKWGRTALILAADEGHIEVVGAEDKTSDLYQIIGFSHSFVRAGSVAPSSRCQT